MIDITKATFQDNIQLLDLTLRCPTGTALVVRQERFGNFFQRESCLDDPQTFVAWDGATAVGVMECGLHLSRINGMSKTAGCLCGTLVDPDYRRMGIPSKLLTACESHFEEKGADIAYCSVAMENLPYLGLLGQRGYQERTKIHQMISLGSNKKQQDDRVRPMEDKDFSEVAVLMNHMYRQHDMYPEFTETTLAENFRRLPGFSLENVYVQESQGDISACLGYWPVSSVISSIVLMWDPKLRAMIGAARRMKRWLNIPHIPETGEAFRHCITYPMAYRHSPRELQPLWQAVHQIIRERELGSLIAYSPDSSERLSGGYSIRAGTRVLLMKSYTGMEIAAENPVFIPPTE